MCDVSRLGISLKDIIKCLQTLHFEVAAVKITAEEVLRMPLPAILFWRQNHFVVLYKIDKQKKRFYVADPAQGKVSFTEDVFMKMWKGTSHVGLAVIMDPSTDFVKDHSKRHSTERRLIKFITSTLHQHKKNFAKVTLLTAIAIAADAYLPMLLQQTIDSGIMHKDIPLVWMFVGSQFLIFLGQYISNCIAHVINTKIGLRMHVGMVTQYLQRLILKPISFLSPL